MRFEKLKDTILFKDAENSIKTKINEIRNILDELSLIVDECEDGSFLEFAPDETIRICNLSRSSTPIYI